MSKELRLINVNKKYKLSNKEYFQALYDINVEFDKGELVSIVGESGSGKSTLMNLIGGLDSDYTGKIYASGEDLSNLSEKQLDNHRKNKVGFVFQSFNLISHLSILDNVTLALTLSNVGEKERIAKATEILKKVGLESQLKKKPTQLSGGQKQRVAIARALINDPDIIIADEPTGALDSGTSMQILEILKDIADSGKLVIMVTHSEKVASISSRVVEISDGRIVADRTNENYKKNEMHFSSIDEDKIAETDKNKTVHQETTSKTKKKKTGKDKQNLSMFSAIRLSLHNMWASKVKNFLMAIGVAIGIGSLILMMSFSSGINDFIDNTMKSYSNPEIVTISKKSESDNSQAPGLGELFNKETFTDDEKTELIDGINAYLTQNNVNFQVTEDKIDPGFNMIVMGTGAKTSYSPTATTIDELENMIKFGDPNDPTFDVSSQSIYYISTNPPYYSDTNVVEGNLGTADGGFVFTRGISKLVGDDAVGKTVRISFNYSSKSDGSDITPIDEYGQICGIMDASFMSGFTMVYVDYDYLASIFDKYDITIAPTTFYINTGSEKITNIINEYLATTNKYVGSIEDQLAGLFDSLSSTIGTSLVVISSISLLVSAMMILVVLYMSVSERTKEIGVLKSIGARRKDIKRIFTSESLLIGLLSGIVGIIFNLLLTLIIWLLLKNTIGIAPVSYRWWYFVVAIVVSVVISMLAGLYPASKAAKLDPVESLRRE